jgi:hypothetical protein
MPISIDPENMNVDELPVIWCPVQEELSFSEADEEIHEQATASLLWVADVPEAILRLLVNETEIERVYAPPPDYDPQEQGEWDYSLETYAFKHAIHLKEIVRDEDALSIVYQLEGAGYWQVKITPERVVIERGGDRLNLFSNSE